MEKQKTMRDFVTELYGSSREYSKVEMIYSDYMTPLDLYYFAIGHLENRMACCFYNDFIKLNREFYDETFEETERMSDEEIDNMTKEKVWKRILENYAFFKPYTGIINWWCNKCGTGWWIRIPSFFKHDPRICEKHKEVYGRECWISQACGSKIELEEVWEGTSEGVVPKGSPKGTRINFHPSTWW